MDFAEAARGDGRESEGVGGCIKQWLKRYSNQPRMLRTTKRCAVKMGTSILGGGGTTMQLMEQLSLGVQDNVVPWLAHALSTN